MKMKHLVIVSLILAIITIGAVSAADDADALAIEDNEALAVDDANVVAAEEGDALAVDDADEVVAEVNNPEDELVNEIAAEDFDVKIVESIDLADYDDINEAYAITFDEPNDASGQIIVDIIKINNDGEKYSEEFGLSDSPISLYDLSIYGVGIYNVNVTYSPYEGESLLLKSGTITVTKTISKDAFYYDIGPDYESDKDAINSKYEDILYFGTPVSGELSVYVNGEKRYNETLKEGQTTRVNAADLGITANDTYEISFKFKTLDNTEFDFGSRSVPVDVSDWTELDDDYVSICNSVDILEYYCEVAAVEDYDDEGIVGTVTLFIDGKLYFTKTFSSPNSKWDEYIDVSDLNIYNNIAPGIHRVKLVYNKNNAKQYVAEKNVEFNGTPDIYNPEEISLGEKENIIITFLKGTTGTVTAYLGVKQVDGEYPDDYYWEIGEKFKTVNIVDGVATIPLDSLPKGEQRVFLDISSSTYDNDEIGLRINVKENTPGITASVSASEITVGGHVVVKFNGPISNEEKVYIYLDDKEIASSLPMAGFLSHTVNGLTVGKHKIGVKFADEDKFYSNTFYVTVKEKSAPKKADKITLTLKKVKVKKSAKKLILQATLKINGKAPKKGTKVTFKFNGKKYTAKTNAKGVAKYTIKKKILKKLKVGKKVKYQVSYGKTTKKLTVKVKK